MGKQTLRGAPPEPRPPAPPRPGKVQPPELRPLVYTGSLDGLHRLVSNVRARLASLVPLFVTRRKVLEVATACAAAWQEEVTGLAGKVDYWRGRFETEQTHARIMREQRDARIEECEDLRKKLRARRKKAKR